MYCPSAESAETLAGLNALQSIICSYGGPLEIENDCAALFSKIKGLKQQ
jgi:hypothetical protein